ncbi:HD-GYP domain-containing protein [Desulfitobacterium sp. Sab5]|uniref:HD-GYP domain-containing protein n=1 Tax=Desulfitobacterium nosdiversum TaxID=3375356 RepID=UPI003CF33CE0
MDEIIIHNLNFNPMLLWHEKLINAVTIVNGIISEIKKPQKARLPWYRFWIYDQETLIHSANVSLLTILIAREMGYQGKNLEEVALGALLHDLGKLEVPKSILNKPGKLTEDEYEVIKKHPQYGMELIKPFCLSKMIQQPIIQHHERWNGKGYPHGLKKEEIHPNAQIVAVADVLAALIEDRSYRQGMGVMGAMEIIAAGKAKEFSPIIVDQLLKVFTPVTH